MSSHGRLDTTDLATYRRMAGAAIAGDWAVADVTSVKIERRLVAVVSRDAPHARETAAFIAGSRAMVLALLDEVDLLRSEHRLDGPDDKTMELLRSRREVEHLRGVIDAFGTGLRELQERAEELADGATKLR